MVFVMEGFSGQAVIVIALGLQDKQAKASQASKTSSPPSPISALLLSFLSQRSARDSHRPEAGPLLFWNLASSRPRTERRLMRVRSSSGFPPVCRALLPHSEFCATGYHGIGAAVLTDAFILVSVRNTRS